MHIPHHLIAQIIGVADKLTLEHVSTGLLIAQQIQLSQMKVKVHALWQKFFGSEDDAE